LGQVFIVSRVSDIVMLPLAVLAGVLGWLFALVWFMLQDSTDDTFFKGTRERNNFLTVLFGGYLLVLLFSTLSPYRFEYSLTAVEQKLLFQSNLVPFKSHLLVHSPDSGFALLRGIGAFIPVGLLLTFTMRVYLSAVKRVWLIFLSALASVIIALCLEFIKVFEVGCYADLTYVLLAALGGAVGSVLFRVLSKTS
jgi:glycopeptide antibiotics resistance protein